MQRRRLDSVLVELGLAKSREEAQRLILAGEVRVGDRVAAKPAEGVPAEAAVRVVRRRQRFASRGGEKLAGALDRLALDVSGSTALDVGASTGGFTDCLLSRGARRVYAVDVGYGQLDWGLRNDPRVTVLERTNARHLRPADLPFEPNLATVDVAFISLAKVLPAVAQCVTSDGEIIALVKPQFELGRGRVRGGVVRSAAERREALLAVAVAAGEIGLRIKGFAPSGLPGPKGNRETFIWCARTGPDMDDVEATIGEIEL
jgi:23S rRNA (cytidine1920-2'-O)/16S rRNA (cytidine1409-2'-O)-methyltransferase